MEERTNEAVKGSIWLFEQEHTLNKLGSGRLWVHAPIALTKEASRYARYLPAW
jgi:hypothetical protein